MKVFFAADHAGFELKNTLLAFVRDELGYEVEDCGALALDTEDDYPPIIAKAAHAVSGDSEARAIILGGSGQGEAMVANRFRNVRAAVCYGSESGYEIAKVAREHNDANVLSLAARFIAEKDALEIVRIFLETPFSGEERHVRRIKQIEDVSR